MNKTDEAFLLEGDIFAPLIAGLSSDNSAIRSATVQHAFRSMDRAAATGTTYGASIVQSLCDIVVTHMFVESDFPRKYGWSEITVGRQIFEQLGRRLGRASDESPERFEAQAVPSTHVFHAPLDKTPSFEVVVSLRLYALKTDSVNVSDCCFSGANFGECSWQYARLTNCDLSYCSFIGAQLGDTVISGDLSHSRFREAVINFADISADITNAFFGNADLQGSRCVFKNASDAIFRGCNLKGANLEGSDDAINLSEAVVDHETVFPDGSLLERKRYSDYETISTKWGEVQFVADRYCS